MLVEAAGQWPAFALNTLPADHARAFPLETHLRAFPLSPEKLSRALVSGV
ncbi:MULTISPECIES: hypothetical protein [unclassified Bradyrhizobium]